MLVITFNVNGIRARIHQLETLIQKYNPDVLCLQECKSPVDKIPVDLFALAGYGHLIARGQKGYNGVAILSRSPITEVAAEDFADLGHARHIAGKLENGLTIHNFYVPAGGDVADEGASLRREVPGVEDGPRLPEPGDGQGAPG